MKKLSEGDQILVTDYYRGDYEATIIDVLGSQYSILVEDAGTKVKS